MKDTETFSELMLRYRGLLFSACRRYARGDLEVDDLLQETTVALWNLRDQLFSITLAPKQAAWIWRVARSTCIDIQRHTPPPVMLPDDYDASTADTSLHDALYEIIAQLPQLDRTIVTMHLEGYEYKEIGQKTGLTKNHVGIRLMRIKEKLKQEMIK